MGVERRVTGKVSAQRKSPRSSPAARRHVELATLAEIGRALLQARLNEDELCELIYQLAGRIVRLKASNWDSLTETGTRSRSGSKMACANPR